MLEGMKEKGATVESGVQNIFPRDHRHEACQHGVRERDTFAIRPGFGASPDKGQPTTDIKRKGSMVSVNSGPDKGCPCRTPLTYLKGAVTVTLILTIL
jgi:hypothetical protein